MCGCVLSLTCKIAHRAAASTRGSLSVEELKEKNRQALLERKKKLDAALPEGWRRVESRSRPGEYVYENIHTEERQAWLPTEPALKPGTCRVRVYTSVCARVPTRSRFMESFRSDESHTLTHHASARAAA
jgi:hypothetical protein